MNPKNKPRALAGTAAVLLLAAGLGGGYWLAQNSSGSGTDGGQELGSSPAAPAAAGEREVLYWYDPMVPDQRFEKPGKSPFMDMELVPKYADEVSSTGVRIDPAVQQNLGVRTEVVQMGSLAGQVRVPGTLTWDLRKETVMSAPVETIVSRLIVKAPYERVQAGQPLAAVLSPAWGSAIAESKALAHADSAYARELQGAAQRRLRTLGLSNTSAGANGAVVLRSPQEGVVSEIMIREGETAMPGTPLFRINGTSTLWLEAAIPQAGVTGIGPGTPVTATVSAVPGRTFEGEVEALLPVIDPASRTQQARVVLRNEDGLLAPGMFAELNLEPEAGAEVPLVPSEALIATGENTRLIVIGPEGNFQPVPVRIGRSSGGRTEILEGLKGGERVVTSGQFLIDSEASLSGALERLEPPAQDGPPADDAAGGNASPGGMDMAPPAPKAPARDGEP